MKQKIYCLIAGTALCMMALPGAMAQNVDAKTSRQKLRAGNEDYKNEKYTEAEVNYRRSLDADPTSEKAVYNIGNALFRQGKFEEAAKQYQSLTAKERPDDDKKETAADWYNLGNSLYMQEKYAESIEAYKNALRRNPDDHEARYNLRMAQLKLRQQQQQQQNQDNQQQQQNQQQQNQQNQNKNQDRDDKNQQQNSPQQQPNQNPQNPERQDDRPTDNGQPQPGSISPENAQQILDAMQQDEKKTQEKVQQKLLDQRQRRKTDKEW